MIENVVQYLHTLLHALNSSLLSSIKFHKAREREDLASIIAASSGHEYSQFNHDVNSTLSLYIPTTN